MLLKILLPSPPTNLTAIIQVVCGLVILAIGVFSLVSKWILPGGNSSKSSIVMRKSLKQTTLPSISYRLKVGNLEQSFTQRIESLETECQFLRNLVLPRPIQSLYIYQVSTVSRHGNLEAGQGELGAAHMEVEKDSPQQSEVQGVQNYDSTVS